jgi:hypothetical protein
MAQYAPAAGKTFFAYAGGPESQTAPPEQTPPQMMVGCFDHRSQTVSRPVVLVENLPTSSYGAPALTLDTAGHVWVFVSCFGQPQPCSIFKSTKPYDISSWEKVTDLNATAVQPWYVPGRGFLVIHSLTSEEQPRVWFSTSPDGLAWSKPQLLADFGKGHTFISGRYNNKVGVMLTYQPEDKPGQFTNLYYLETSDFGRTWQAYPRKNIDVPLRSADGPAMVCNFGAEWRYLLRDFVFDARGNPIVLYIMRHTKNVSSLPNTRIWYTTRWAIREWETTSTVRTDSDFDGGCISSEKIVWYMTVPTIAGPQPNNAGGSLVRWRSEDQGRSWYPQQLTHDESVNSNWVRHPVDAAPEMSLLWADGDMRKPSPSRICFADREGNAYVLPTTMPAESQKPELVWKAPPPKTQPATDSAPAANLPRLPTTQPSASQRAHD